MYVFVFEGVLQDWSFGMAVIVAESLERAQQMAWERFTCRCDGMSFENWLSHEDNEGFLEPKASYPTSAEEEALHYVYGGG